VTERGLNRTELKDLLLLKTELITAVTRKNTGLLRAVTVIRNNLWKFNGTYIQYDWTGRSFRNLVESEFNLKC
jgi:hypothetical protein